VQIHVLFKLDSFFGYTVAVDVEMDGFVRHVEALLLPRTAASPV
jgi:hypothetical protein